MTLLNRLWRELDESAHVAAFDLRQVMRAWPSLPDDPQLGHAAPHTPKLDLADYVAAGAEPPPAVHRSHLSFPFGILANDRLGNCGEAMVIHAIEAFHLSAHTTPPPFVDQDAIKLYSDVMGYVPGDPSTDQGTDNHKLVDFWKNTGVTCAAEVAANTPVLPHKIAGSLFVDPKDTRLTRIAIWEFVVMFRAIGLPITAQGKHEWKLVDPSLQGPAGVGSWGYHDIPYLSYDQKRIRNVSWGQELLVDWDFDLAYADSGFVVVSRDMLNRRGMSPSGVNWTALLADLAKL